MEKFLSGCENARQVTRRRTYGGKPSSRIMCDYTVEVGLRQSLDSDTFDKRYERVTSSSTPSSPQVRHL